MRLRFILAMALVAVVAVLCVVVFFRLDAADQLNNYLFRGGMYGMTGLVDGLEEYYQSNGSWQGVEEVIGSAGMMMGQGANSPGFRRGQGGMPGMGAGMMQIELVSQDGVILYDSRGQSEGVQLSTDILDQAVRLQDARGNTIGYLLIGGGGALSQGNQQLLINLLNSAALSAGLVALAVGLTLALALTSGLIRPVRRLTRAAQAMAGGDLSQRVEVRGRDEIAALGKSFNLMAESLEESERQRQAMTADVAHELRTPLAVQRAQVEAMLDGVYPLDEGNLIKVLEQNELLSRLVEDLRTLALADAGELKLDKTGLELVNWIHRLVERFEPAAGSRRLSVQSAQAECKVEADPTRLEQILNNLLSNAVRHTPEGGEISIAISRDEKNVFVEVHDTGEGIPPEALNKIFDRFYRAEPSRSRAEGGTGLGLAIARQLALAHGGELTAANHPRGGAVFTLRLPRMKQE
jgi:two-component system OmpR family sensor kinase/two-component system sensor histidine kinase BaeS